MAGRRTTAKINVETIENTEKKLVDEAVNEPIKLKKQIPLDKMITVKNATNGKLIYVDSDGYANIMENFGDTIELEMRELYNIKKRCKKFFSENWIEVEPMVLNVLGVEKYYANSLKIDDYDNLFKLTPEELKEKISSFSSSIKHSVGMRAISLIENGELDSMKKIKVLEEALGYKLIEE